MKIIKEGSVCFKNGDIIISGFEVENGTSEELRAYAISKIPINLILMYKIFYN